MVEQPLDLQRRLTLQDARAVGGPVALPLLAAYFGVALVGWLASSATLLVAAPEIARGDVGAAAPVLAVHLLALGFLPLAVSGGAFHLLPVMLRNPLHDERRLWAALPLLAVGGWLVAPGVAFDVPGALWPGAALVSLGLMLVLVELGGLVVRAPRGRTLVASRAGVALSLFHAVAALTLGTIVFDRGDAATLGVTHGRWMLVHLHLAALGWLALLIVTVGRTLGPMLALAPAAPTRRLPLDELLLTLALWLLAIGIALSNRPLSYLGAVLAVLTLVRFARLLVRVARSRRMELEGPLLHLLAGAASLAQAAVVGFTLLAAVGPESRGLAAYGLLLLFGWAAGVTLGHLPKLLSLSIWVWWPPGPRPKQATLYPRRAGQLAAAGFAAGIEVVALGAYLGSGATARIGAAGVVASALLTAATTADVWRRKRDAMQATIR